MSLIFITNSIKKYVRTSEFQLSREKIKKKNNTEITYPKIWIFLFAILEMLTLILQIN